MKEEAIKELLTRGVERIYPNAEFLEAHLKSSEPLSLYLGIDPTGPTLHLGHIIPLLKLAQFQELGHKIILLIGDFTGMIGDPTGKSATRKKLTRDEVLSNAKLYKEQASRIIKFNGENSAVLRYNSEWLGKLTFTEVLELCSNMTHSQAIKRDMFQKRIAEGKDLFLHELLYPLMQGYDSVVMGVDGEIGGNDQTFNMLAGRDLAKKINKKEKFVFATKLLTDSVGGKMGKTEGNMVAITDSPADMFGKVMSWPDSMILIGFELCTRVSLNEIEEIKSALSRGENPKDAKTRLAFEIVALLKGKEDAEKAHSEFAAAFSDGKPKEFVEIKISSAQTLSDALIEKKIVESKTELRRLIADGAITSVATGEKTVESFLKNPPAGEYRIGKHRFIKIVK
ncbi:MAG: tyrosine--tRNA ligase [Candidatus Taylorbacteria bacterium RIFCSPHIGHO2_02_FULL_47_18]|uniref:Tyrosine--tRNA ligase n=1 Tax=Candidatus Taylorbacteria bacterium RIFCSPLOWO2_01_FULL_48_100 TaxID=1802322 RepID=A0A1G2NEJ2_9BACT|nr:MAG: tyrosine--tRNA ligase [Candidatus Taylorbacteria bacterium RIFCSPHIGHO2_01_FULL_48_38]OHA28234.1 MAG: tyrosine--tRNA ligase [Candidatus Taylorbacteria bacterium RIFCSPHIGHO2_02_FULL_47_18]OHA33879.1 MAG: tyrosine--tRNA ligase [Candidatus Taylorbacteria bacterium RIFCSPLOWO2_01_FULL_48_100]OHA40854.1 MAG: tyrosine--tRNA ligase [Candidatus Taylorbacteria bacterium RIFCSPLOWO2_02_FULL_48_16]OHA45134.1 MAG: tyrosine--tRNA ligase [Candidatus Taylorbacteria bacterium RIFCSPLOWO2_12_FULL_48_11